MSQLLSTSLHPVYQVALRELAANLYYLVSQYLYLVAHTSGSTVNVIGNPTVV